MLMKILVFPMVKTMKVILKVPAFEDDDPILPAALAKQRQMINYFRVEKPVRFLGKANTLKYTDITKLIKKKLKQIMFC
ncbi:hypothetical protein PR048_015906 [Dryococelus australis]|uniref:Uncharacterized protein n=1 Tax=Dryococelus australis TaxID=614101 RepID=A0ABQ9HIK5_9NEOP|nr:hypothetical protein PR048_015906 [Dryococelus australis]